MTEQVIMLLLTATHPGQQRIGSERFNPTPHEMHYDVTSDHEVPAGSYTI